MGNISCAVAHHTAIHPSILHLSHMYVSSWLPIDQCIAYFAESIHSNQDEHSDLMQRGRGKGEGG